MNMLNKIRFGDFTKEVQINYHEISYKDIFPKPQRDEHGEELPFRPARIDLRAMDVYRLLKPYVSVRFIEQVKVVVPLTLYLALFQIFILRQSVEDSATVVMGLVSVIIGLMLFMEGLKLGLMPFGESIGNTLLTKSPLWVVLVIAFLLGVGVTFAEPAIGALKAAGSIVDPQAAPYLYLLLNDWADTLVLMVGVGVGLAVVAGTLRFIYGWSLKPMIYASLLPTLGLTIYIMTQPRLSNMVGLAWDCGAVTTGPVTVPLVLALGIGIAASAGRGNSSLSVFGLVTLASLFPIIAVLALGVYASFAVSPGEILAAVESASQAAPTAPAWYQRTPGQEIALGVRAIVPLVVFLLIVIKLVIRERIRNAGTIAYGIGLCIVGMCIFNIGLSYGLAKLGGQSGGMVPAAFAHVEGVADSPLYLYGLGLVIAIGFAWFLGFGATLAEPALNAFGITVQNLTNGAFPKKLLLYAVSFGVACGVALGVVKIIFGIPIGYLLIPGYTAGVILTAISSEEFVNVAWDSAGVTTGPVTVPLVLAMGLGFGNSVDALDGFGILSMASICPILSVLTCGLYIRHIKTLRRKEETLGATA
jgi:hypothetical protein